MDYAKIKKVYIIGIEGGGTSALASLYINMGKEVNGSDEGDHFFADILKEKGIVVYREFKESNIPTDIDLIIYSTAYTKENNVELAKALKLDKEVISYPEALADLFKQKKGIAVCGSHGKTTVTAWLGYVMKETKQQPSIIVGAKVPQLGSGVVGQSDYLIVEADEYQNKLKMYEPKIALLNNIDYDHPDFFPTKEDYYQVFVDFIKKLTVENILIANFDDSIIEKIVPVNLQGELISYGIKNEQADFIAKDIKIVDSQQQFTVVKKGQEIGEFTISLLGKHNVYNALAVITACSHLGIAMNDIKEPLANFKGAVRRLQYLGDFNGTPIIDDFAHHPTEIKASLEAVSQKYPDKKIVAVFHPHTFSRTKALFNDFVNSFGLADELIILDIYASARETEATVTSEELVEKIRLLGEEADVKYIPTLTEVESYLRNNLKKEDVLLLIGAGNIFDIGYNLLNNENRK